MKKVLITGGAGFIGSNLAKKLLENNYHITVLDSFSEQIHGNNPPFLFSNSSNINIVKADVRAKDILYGLLSDCNILVHYAAETGTGQSMYKISHYIDVNIQATADICDFIVNNENKIENIIVASSRSIYGEGKYMSDKYGYVYPESRSVNSLSDNFEVKCPISKLYNLSLVATTEDSKIHPSSFYGITKQVQEQLFILTAKIKNIKGFALRYQNVYGPGQSLQNPYTGILSIFTRLALKNEPINIFEDGLESRDFVYIDDIVEATYACIENNIDGQHILNIGSGRPTTVLEVAREIVSYLNSSSEIIISGNFREGDIRHNYADLKLVKQILNFEPKIDFKTGLHNFIDWAITQSFPNDFKDYEKSINELKEKGLLK
jgi:dTDP-L-rhamnose 4-epimerase